MPARTKKAAATTLPPTNLERFIAAETAKQRKQPKTQLQRETAKVNREQLENEYINSLVGVPEPERQVYLIRGRRYRGDCVWRNVQLVCEVDGGAWLGARGGHTSAAGMERDRIRDCLCIEAGWTVLRFTANMIRDRSAADFTERIYKQLAQRRQGAA